MKPSAAALYYAGCEESHFLEACFLCQRPLGRNSDIFMYRGNTPFCSKECRQEQIEMDEAKEKRWRKHAAAASNRSTKPDSAIATASTTTTTPTPGGKPVQTGSVAVA